MKQIFWILIMYLFGGSLLGVAQAQRRCITMQLDSALRDTYPELGNRMAFEGWLQRVMQESESASSRTVFVIPVVVHLVHDGAPIGVGANLSADRVASQLTVLNEDFRRALGTPGHNTHPAGADIEIEFCPVTISPDGQSMAEPGIHRIDRNQLGLASPPYSSGQVRGNIMPVTYWDPDQYMNIWVLDLTDDVLGFAQLPNQSTLPGLVPNQGPATTDGVVIDPDNFGRGLGTSNPYDQGRTTTHEVGHWLGLIHIWGDGNCNVDDFCADTPPAANPNYGCPSNPVSCGNADMYQNYMDYTDDACMNLFTQCQRTRMRTVMANAQRRASLLTSRACDGQLAPLAQFSASQSRVCAGGVVSFSDQSLYGPDVWQWSFPGGTPATSTDASPAVTYATPGTYDVSLTVSNSLGTHTILDTAAITVLSGSGVIVAEDFEDGLNGWEVDNPDGGITWQLVNVSGNGGHLAPGINLFLYSNLGQRDALISPPLDLRNYVNLTLRFDYAYRPFSSQEQDSLIVRASINGGQTYPHLLYANAQGGNQAFATGPVKNVSFTPNVAADWCGQSSGAGCITLQGGDLSALQGASQVRLRFESVNDFGNNLYVDNVELSGECFVAVTHQPTPAPAPDASWRVYPVPANDRLFVMSEEQDGTWLRVGLFDGMGRQVLRLRHQMRATQPLRIAVGQLPRGLYQLRLQSDGLKPQVQSIWLR